MVDVMVDRGVDSVFGMVGHSNLGQYLAEFTTAVKYAMPITHVVLNNDEFSKISREQVAAERPVWQTDFVNSDFAVYADLCGGRGFRVDRPEDLQAVSEEALSVADGPSLVEARTSPRWTRRGVLMNDATHRILSCEEIEGIL